MTVLGFHIEESKVNAKRKILVATCLDGSKWVVGADIRAPTYLEPYEDAWDTNSSNKIQ